MLQGRVGVVGTNGILNDVEPGTRVEYSVVHDGVETNKAVETFEAA